MTIGKWYKNIDFTAGINRASLETIKKKVNLIKDTDSNSLVFCNLVMDEMSVRKSVEIINDKGYGYIDVGDNMDGIDVPEAENVLLVMIVCENGKFKIPVFYYFIKSLTGEEKAKIVIENLRALHDTGITVTSVTFDGLQSNAAMCNVLGGKHSLKNDGKYFFPHPITEKEIFIIYDGFHVLKLIRNALASGKDMYDSEGNIISWTFISQLQDFQEINGLHAANKLRKEHIRWNENKMNVRIAAQTLSNSVSVSLLFLKEDLKMPEFQDVTGTAKFCNLINDAFDILNSRVLFHKEEYKRGISEKNVEDIVRKINDIIPYIENLKYFDGMLVINSRKKTGFRGIIYSLQNVINIYNTYFKDNNYYLLTYKLSQDHLETFFSAVRSKGGNNNNPTCYQFLNIVKKLLIHADIKESQHANCISVDDTEMLRISPETWKSFNKSMSNMIIDCEIDNSYTDVCIENSLISSCDNF